MSNYDHINIRLEPSLLEQLRQQAEEDDRSLSSYLRRELQKIALGHSKPKE